MKHPDDNETIVLPYHTHKLQLRYLKTLSSGWYFRTTINLANYQIQYLPYELGYMISQNFGHRGNKKIHGDGFIGYFNRNIISSSTEQINGNSRTDIFTYLVWKF